MSAENPRHATISIVFGLAVIAAILFTARHTTQNRDRAKAFLREASALQLRVSTLTQVQQLVSRYGGLAEPGTCDLRGCSYFFSFDNGWLRRLHLAPQTRFSCTLGVSGGVLDYRRVFLTSGNTSAVFGAFVEEQLSPPKGISEPFYISRQWEKSGERWRVHVAVTPDATAEERRIAYALNLNCLSKLGGCKDAQQLLPSVTWGGASSNVKIGDWMNFPREPRIDVPKWAGSAQSLFRDVSDYPVASLAHSSPSLA